LPAHHQHLSIAKVLHLEGGEWRPFIDGANLDHLTGVQLLPDLDQAQTPGQLRLEADSVVDIVHTVTTPDGMGCDDDGTYERKLK